jgi:hypothetical protein
MQRTALVVMALVAACASGDAEPVPHVRLGMAPRDVRERFAPGGDGAWQSALGIGDDTALEWSARDGAATMAEARFEFHLGMLVAIRARARESSSRERISTTRKTVTIRTPAPEGGTNVTVLARDCPTHRDEAERYAAREK